MARYILISGKAENGKDELALMLKKEIEKQDKKATIIGFGDIVKFIAKKFHGWNGEKDEVGRTILQTDVGDHIKATNKKYFAQTLLEMCELTKGKSDEYIIIPDLRFTEEIEALYDYNIYNHIIIRIDRPNHVSRLTPEQLNHRSEIDLDDYDGFDIKVENTTKEKLAETAKGIVENLDNMYFQTEPYIKENSLRRKKDLIAVQNAISLRLRNNINFDHIKFVDVSAGGISVSGIHKQVNNYYFVTTKLKYDFSNMEECVNEFVDKWKEKDNDKNVADMNDFIRRNEKYGWD